MSWKRTLFVLPLLGGCAVCWGQGLESLVDLEFSGRCADALAKVAKETGLKIAANPALGEEPVILLVDDVPAGALLDKIALAARGEWSIERDGTRRLIPRKGPSAAETRRAKRIEAIKREQAAILAAEANRAPFDPEALRKEVQSFADTAFDSVQRQRRVALALSSQFPHQGLAKSIYARLDPVALADVHWGRAQVWMTNPTAAQNAYPASMQPVFTEFRDLFTRWNAAVRAAPIRPASGTALPDEIWPYASAGPPLPAELSFGAYAFTNLAEGAWSVSVQGYDATGMFRFRGEFRPDRLESLRSIPMEFWDRLLPAGDPREPDVELPASSKPLAHVFSDTNPNRTQADLDATLEAMLKVRESDPVTWVLPAYLRALRAKSGLDIVASPCDDTVWTAIELAHSYPKASALFRALSSRLFISRVSEANGWFVWEREVDHPFAPSTVDRRRSREELDKMLKVLHRERGNELEILGEYCWRALDSRFDMLSMDLPLVSWMLYLTGRDGTLINAPWLRLYGSLSVEQRRELLAGGQLMVSRLTPAQRELADSLVYGPTGMDVNHSGPPISILNYVGTWRFPNGIPAGATLSIQESSEQRCDVYPATNEAGFRMLSVADLGMRLAEADRRAPGFLSQFTLWKRRTLTLRFDLGGTAYREARITSAGRMTEQRVPFEQLPKEFQAEVLKAKAKAQEDWEKQPPPRFPGKRPDFLEVRLG